MKFMHSIGYSLLALACLTTRATHTFYFGFGYPYPYYYGYPYYSDAYILSLPFALMASAIANQPHRKRSSRIRQAIKENEELRKRVEKLEKERKIKHSL